MLYDGKQFLGQIEEENEETQAQTRKRNKKDKEIKEKQKKQDETKKKFGNHPFLVLEGVTESSETYGQTIMIDSTKYPEGYQFGSDYKFKKNIKANNESRIYFDKEKESWFIKGHKITDPKFKVFQTRVSVGLYDKITNGENSDPAVLQKGMIIHICGFSFKVDE